MMLAIEIGQRFGNLTVLAIHTPGKGRGTPRRAQCLCDCGGTLSVGVSRLFYGLTAMCRKCWKYSVHPPVEVTGSVRFRQYKHSARYRGHFFELSLENVTTLCSAECRYCGLTPSKGIDRRDSAKGYIIENCVPCCKRCNYAKREIAEADFLSWISRIATKQGFSL